MFAMTRRPKGLFGSPGYAGPYDMSAAPAGDPGLAAEAQAPAKKHGFFGQGGTGRAIAGTIGDVLLQRGGMAPIYAPTMAFQQKSLLEQQQAERERQAKRGEWLFQQQWERDHPKPVNNDTERDLEWYKGLTEADRELYHRMHPQYMTVDNGDGTKSIIPIGANGPVMGGSAVPRTVSQSDWDSAKPVGGAASNGGGNFPGGY